VWVTVCIRGIRLRVDLEGVRVRTAGPPDTNLKKERMEEGRKRRYLKQDSLIAS
jgi:hypothetical protein